LPAYWAISGKSLPALGIAKQSVSIEAVFARVGFARAVAVALPVAIGKLDSSNLGGNPIHNLIHLGWIEWGNA
jgi:hypothetical protein